ncbi:MAG: flagellar biosynthesis protein FlhB [Myxococcales bacterium]|nr:flagellar biosynthesis protein FlhB [Myxococcales bacterium]MCB9644535.1 flagellar biosynthesis protein FlhB [Myxococcales bacterium]
MSGDKTEEPTEHKLREARKKGQIAKSQDITAAAIFLIGFLVVYFQGRGISDKLMSFIQVCFYTATRKHPDIGIIISLSQEAISVMLNAVLPLCFVAFAVAFLANYIQVGVLITFEPLKPELKKLNPIDGIKNMFKLRKIVELVKSTLKLTIVSFMAYTIVKDRVGMIVMSIRMPVFDSIALVWDLLFELSVKIGVVFGVIAAADWYYQKWQYKKDMMMSKKDIKDEYKNQEGDPYIKGMRRQMHQEMSMNDAVNETGNADAVIVNPEHIAVAIKYDKEGETAPKVVAKGERLWAQKIKEIAKEKGIPILRNVPLAAALNKLDLGQEIPEELYDAVAEILQFVYQLAEERGETK